MAGVRPERKKNKKKEKINHHPHHHSSPNASSSFLGAGGIIHHFSFIISIIVIIIIIITIIPNIMHPLWFRKISFSKMIIRGFLILIKYLSPFPDRFVNLISKFCPSMAHPKA
jgi:hypothetical protein